MSQKINGALISYVGIAGNIAVALLFTPFLVSSFGPAGYGLLSIVIAFMAYLNMLDFGLNDSLLRFFVGHRSDKQATSRFLGRMLGLYILIGALILLGGQGLAAVFSVIFAATMSAEEIALLQSMIQVMSVGAAVLIALNPVSALNYAHERFVFMRSLEMLVSWGTTGVIVLFLLQGYGLMAVAMITAGGKVAQALMSATYAAAVLKIRLRIHRPDWAELRRVFVYAAPIFVSILAGQAFWKLDNILVGAILGAAPVAVYAIGVTFNKYFMTFSTAISRIVTPDVIRQIDAGADADTLTDLMIRISRIQAMAILLILGGLIVFGQRFLTLWLGPEFAVSYFVMIAVLCPFALELTGNARNIILQVKGLYWRKSAITAVTAALNIPLTLWLLHIWGVVGAAISTGAAVFIGYLLIAMLLKHRVGLSMWRYWRETARRIVPVFGVLVAGGLLLEPLLPSGWIGLLIGAFAFGGAYLAGMILLAANSYERGIMKRVVSRVGL
ncbi:MAG: oligosaccharide flippase family protein [Brevundimonas sp.]